MIAEHRDPGGLLILANFVSPLAVDLRETSILRRWSEQASRKIWLTRPGDLLVVPLPLSDAFRRYALRMLAMPEDSVTVVTVPDTTHAPMAEAIAMHGLLEPLRALVHERPGTRLLPTALDEASVALAADLGIPVAPYGADRPSRRVVRTVADLNTKSGFRSLADRLGMRLPSGRVCTGADLPRTIDDMLSVWERVVVKTDRSAGGHGLSFVTRGEPWATAPVAPDSRWVVERYVEHTRAVSAQGHVARERATALYDGEMRMCGGSFAGYRSPLNDLPETARAELADWTIALGRHLGAEGYLGPYSLDAVCARDGGLHALECNVRRTATTTTHTLVTRLVGEDPAPVWSMGTFRAGPAMAFDTVREGLIEAGLDFRPGGREGVVLYTDRPADGVEWRYVALATDLPRLDELEARLTTAFAHEGVEGPGNPGLRR
ncbi:peptide ligase PGM1-related protein [Embleya sp. NPDC050154]|uniref:preATP grasp domain-containing protein n=1 Tax=unclassified Embleya TaxID=2699296 RepID=UPI0037BACCE6